MAKHDQLVGGSADWADEYVGLEREIVIDESNEEIRVQDGVTPGGHRIPNRDSNDTRYQQRNDELTAFAGFDPSKRGFLSRLAPASYQFRQITVNESNLEITNPDGYLGNPLIEIAATILTNHTFSGDITFTEPVTLLGGILGNSQGTHVGNVIGDVTGNLTGNSAGTHTGPVIGNVTGGIDARGATVQFDDGQIPFSKLSGVPAGVAPIPAGGIIMWSGDSTDIPDGWFLCDGDNGTPDLRGQFIVAASANGGDSPAHASGGSETHTHILTVAADGAHSHNITVAGHQLTTAEIPAHFHGSGVCDTVSGNAFNHGTIAASPAAHDNIQSDSGTVGGFEAKTTSVGGDGTHTHGASSDSAGNHTHGATAATASSIPPFYSLCFIMRGVG